MMSFKLILRLMLCWIIFCNFVIFDCCGETGEPLCIRCPPDQTIEVPSELYPIMFPDPQVCSGTYVNFTQIPTFFQVGKLTNTTLTATDSNGNEISCSFLVTTVSQHTTQLAPQAETVSTTPSTESMVPYVTKPPRTTSTATSDVSNVSSTKDMSQISGEQQTSISKVGTFLLTDMLKINITAMVQENISTKNSTSLTTSRTALYDTSARQSIYLLIAIIMSGGVVILSIFLTLSCCLIFKYRKRARNGDVCLEQVARHTYENENGRNLARSEVHELEERNTYCTMDKTGSVALDSQSNAALIRIPSFSATITARTYQVDFSEP